MLASTVLLALLGRGLYLSSESEVLSPPTSPTAAAHSRFMSSYDPNDAHQSQFSDSDLLATVNTDMSADLLAAVNTDTSADLLAAVNTDTSADPIATATLKIDLVVVPYFSYKASDNGLVEREKEYLTVLQRNLGHDLVSRIHVLTTNASETWERFNKFELPSQNKLLVSEVESVDLVRDIFEYISQNLVGKHVMFTNADIWLGNGFDQVDPLVMCKRRILYAITRQITEEERCGMKDYCLELQYMGSHDTFLFYLNESIPEQALKHLNFKFPARGTENVLMWVFLNELKYCILNPCSILETFHFHCSGLRNQLTWKKVSNANYTCFSPFTKNLICLPELHTDCTKFKIP